MKKRISLILAVLIVALFGMFAVASSSDSTDTPAQTEAKGEAAVQVTEGNVGKYTVDIKSARLTETYDGKPVVVITYGFTNNSDDAQAFYLAFEDSVFQNGVGLEKAYVLTDSDPYDDGNQSKEIKKGASLDVEVAYKLNDSETDVDVEIKELFSFNDDVVTRTFSIK